MATVSLATGLIATAMLAGGVSGADTRVLWIGAPDLTVDTDPDVAGPDNNGKLFPTTVTVPESGKGPYATKFEVQILNGGGQNLSNIVVTINADVQGSAALTLNTAGIYDPDGGTDADNCTTSGDTVTCTYPGLPAGTHRTVAVVVNVTSAYVITTPKPLFSANVTTNNENGSNTQSFNATSGSFGVSAAGCSGTASWFLGTQKVNLEDGGTSCSGQDAVVTSGRNGDVALGGNGGFATVQIGGDQTGLCPAGYRCYGKTVDVSILGGNPVPGGVQWTITWNGIKTIKGVIHYGDSYPTNPNDYTVITFNKQGQCSTTKLTDCWVSPLVTTSKPASITATIVTAANGKTGGWT
jgi:hypothetical protein